MDTHGTHPGAGATGPRCAKNPALHYSTSGGSRSQRQGARWTWCRGSVTPRREIGTLRQTIPPASSKDSTRTLESMRVHGQRDTQHQATQHRVSPGAQQATDLRNQEHEYHRRRHRRPTYPRCRTSVLYVSQLSRSVINLEC